MAACGGGSKPSGAGSGSAEVAAPKPAPAVVDAAIDAPPVVATPIDAAPAAASFDTVLDLTPQANPFGIELVGRTLEVVAADLHGKGLHVAPGADPNAPEAHTSKPFPTELGAVDVVVRAVPEGHQVSQFELTLHLDAASGAPANAKDRLFERITTKFGEIATCPTPPCDTPPDPARAQDMRYFAGANASGHIVTTRDEVVLVIDLM